MSRALRRATDGLGAIATALSSVALAFMMGVIVLDVILRAANPEWRIFGVLDLVEFSLDWMIALSLASAIFAGQIIAVDLLERIDPRGWLRIAGLSLLLVALVTMGWQTIEPAMSVRQWGETTLDLRLPKFWYWIAIWVGLSFAVVATCAQLARALTAR